MANVTIYRANRIEADADVVFSMVLGCNIEFKCIYSLFIDSYLRLFIGVQLLTFVYMLLCILISFHIQSCCWASCCCFGQVRRVAVLHSVRLFFVELLMLLYHLVSDHVYLFVGHVFPLCFLVVPVFFHQWTTQKKAQVWPKYCQRLPRMTHCKGWSIHCSHSCHSLQKNGQFDCQQSHR